MFNLLSKVFYFYLPASFVSQFFDLAEPYQLSFQDSATDILEGILNLHIRNFLLSELSQADLSFLSTDLNSFKSFGPSGHPFGPRPSAISGARAPIMFNSSSSSFPVQPSARSSAGGLFFTPSYTVPVISKEIRFKILEINLNSHNFVV